MDDSLADMAIAHQPQDAVLTVEEAALAEELEGRPAPLSDETV
ncbi:hypothetical protein [Streptomyces sp. NPDC050485]